MRQSARLLVIGLVTIVAALAQPAFAQDPIINHTPTVDTVPANSHPAPPAGWKQTCLIKAEDPPLPSPTCPVLRYNAMTYWVWADINNPVTMMIAAYDANGTLVQKWEKGGARYIWKITIDSVNHTVAFVGQANGTVTVSWAELGIAVSNDLAVAVISQQNLSCLLATNCQVTPTDTNAAIPLPQPAGGTGQLTTRTMVGQAGAPAAGKTLYAYRLDLTGASSQLEVSCATDLTVSFGAATPLNYANNQPGDVFVIQAGPSNVGVFSATRSGNDVLLVFNQPICASQGAKTTAFFGLASGSAPKAISAKLGWTSILAIDVPARGPAF